MLASASVNHSEVGCKSHWHLRLDVVLLFRKARPWAGAQRCRQSPGGVHLAEPVFNGGFAPLPSLELFTVVQNGYKQQIPSLTHWGALPQEESY